MRILFNASTAMLSNFVQPAQIINRFLVKVLGLFLFFNVMIIAHAKADYTVPAGTTVDASTLVGKTGVLTVNGQINLTQNTTLSFTSVIINGPSGNINWVKQNDLTFPAGTSIVIINPGSGAGLQPTTGNGNGAQRLIVGNIIFAVSSDNANNAYFSFEQFNEFGGLPEYQITGNQTACSGSPINLTIKPIHTASGINHSYDWSIKPVYTIGNNKTSSITLNNLPVGTYIVTCITTTTGSKNDPFSTTETISITILPKNTWLGITSEWTDAVNWCPAVPTKTEDVVIPVMAAGRFYPEIGSGAASVKNITIAKNASFTIKNLGLLKVYGNITNNGVLNAEQGSVEFSGTTAQTVSGSWFKGRTIRNLIVSNPAGLQVSNAAGDTLNITGNLTFGAQTTSLNTGDNITLKSTIEGTANIGVVGTGNSIKGKFIVERYINTGTDKSLGQHGKAWMLLATPTIGSTIFESWQEGGKSTGKTPIANNNAGFGTLLTTPFNNVPANGFDLYTGAGPSIKRYDSKTNSFDNGPVSTNDPVYNEKGYLIMVRGDRSIFTHNAPAKPVILRTKGEIVTGKTKAINVAANKWESIGNPYAARIYINKIGRTGGVDEFITVWDPKLGGSYGLGGYQTMVKLGSGYTAVPGGGSYGKGEVSYIESGQAFFVQATKDSGTVFFTEDAKVPAVSNNVGRGAGTVSNLSFLRSTLYALGSGEAVLADGNILLTGNFSNEIDGMDARKMSNSAENFSILSTGINLAVESRRDITSNDTIFFSMTSMRAQTYRLELIAEKLGMPGMLGWLEDKFTGTKTPLNLDGATEYEFTVSSQAGAAAADRLMIIFRAAAVLPVTFTEVKATRNNQDILVEWTVETESNLKQYEVERSADGNVFTKVATIEFSKINGGKYQWLDQAPVSGYNYYRIRSVDLDGKSSLTQIVKVMANNTEGSISIYPNPVVKGTVSVQLGNQPKGVYTLRLLNPVGQVMSTTKINHAGGNYTEKMNWDSSLPRGMYTLEVRNIQTGITTIKLMF